FNISMDDAFGVSSIERIRHVIGEGEERVELRRTVCQRVLECLAIEILHHDERTALVITDFVNSTNIRMIECRSRTGFTTTTLQRGRTSGEVLGKELECADPPKLRALGFVDNPHPAAADFFEDAVVCYGQAEEF